MRRVPIIALLVVLATLAAYGCTGGTAPPDGSDLRGRLARALEPTDPEAATLVRDEQRTTLTEVPAGWLAGWVLVDVLHRGANHPRRLHVALSDRDAATVLTRNPEGFNAVVRNTATPTADQAAEIARTYLDVTRDFAQWSYRVESIDAIEWLPKPDATQAKDRDRLITKFGDTITAPKPVTRGAGWAVNLWTVTGTDLVRHQVLVGSDATVAATGIVVAQGIPVPASR